MYNTAKLPLKTVINNSITINGETPFINAVKIALGPRQPAEQRQLMQDSASDLASSGMSSPAQCAIQRGKQLVN